MYEKGRVLLIIPAFNEEENISNVILGLNNYPEYDYIIVNDGSTDNTEKICEENRYNVINLPINLGIGGAVQTGYCYAKKMGYSIAVQFDGDGQHDILDVEKVIKPIRENKADVSIGSRFLEYEGFQSSLIRRIGIRLLGKLIYFCTGKSVRDVTSGFRAVNRKFIEIYANDYSTDYPEPEAIVTALMYKGRIIEVPVIMKERKKGESSISLGKSVYYMIKVSLAILVKRISYVTRK